MTPSGGRSTQVATGSCDLSEFDVVWAESIKLFMAAIMTTITEQVPEMSAARRRMLLDSCPQYVIHVSWLRLARKDGCLEFQDFGAEAVEGRVYDGAT